MTVIIETERLVIRRFTPADLDAFHTYRDDPHAADMQGWPSPYPRERAEELVDEFVREDLWRNGFWTQLALARKDAPDELIGDVGIRLEPIEPTAELGFTIAPAHRGQRYGGEALTAVAEFMFERLGQARVVAFTLERNVAAQKALEAAGLRFIALDGDELVYYRRAEITFSPGRNDATDTTE